ncbi:hypothetical protein [Paracidovorax konjaci]|uniref:Uncharacterized protein n=1 Tax=Paracidovorax konjaci TaxID=32040 RepID=A0A1I1YDJ4_9BURK|nr:hypothetical protein [Paracidovorax konjaci]SFE15990.1 hypothetical protein SAMN04489710_11666 [Paracidovorax konjaci]
MARTDPPWRPLPEQVVVVAFPTACRQAAWPGAAGAPASFFIVQATTGEIELPQTDFGWLQLSAPEPIAPGWSRVGYQAGDNTLDARRVPVPVLVRQQRYAVEFLQQAGLLVQTEMVRVLNSPLNIDCLMAVMFIASLIKKIPVPPIKVLVTVLAVLALIALGMAVSLLRHGFARVPEPLPLSTDTNGVPIEVVPGVSVQQGLPLAQVPAEDQTILLQTVKEIYWLLRQVA